MNNRRRLNKKRVIIAAIIIISIIVLPIFGRYTFNAFSKMYSASKKFYFTSNLLGENKAYSNWGGSEVYVINFELYSYDNKFRRMTDDLNCTIEAEVTSGSATCYMVIGSDTSTQNTTSVSMNKVITSANDNTLIVSVYVVPTENIDYDDTVTISISATSTYPFNKELTSTITLTSSDQTDYKIVDNNGDNYAQLILANSKQQEISVSLTFDPSELEIDSYNSIFADSNTSYTVTTIYGVDYISSVEFKMNAESSKSIKFYKANRNNNYTFEQNNNQTSESIIDVKF